MPRNEKWSLKFDCCVNCGRNDVKHIARGLCLNCYRQETEKRNRGKQRLKKGLASHKLNYEYLQEEYGNKKRSLGDIAKDCNCSRQYVYKKFIEFNIPLRNRKEARELACDRNKIEFKRIDEGGHERLVILDKIRVNDSFFSSWSNEMAYVLGVIYTDGNLDPGSKLDPSRKTTLKTPRLSISQKEPELLNKVLKLMECDAKLYHHTKRKYETGIAGDLHWFHINNEKIYSDLINLGLSPKKSKNIEFPNIPKKYVSHFIRGCWDGDGSIFFDQNKLIASYISGSEKFIERLIEELYKFGISKAGVSYKFENSKKVLQPLTKEMLSKYPDGRFPLVIFKDKRANAYYIKIRGKENIEKLFHYFYDGVDESMYLSRKYKVFVKGLKLVKREGTEQLTLDLDF